MARIAQNYWERAKKGRAAIRIKTKQEKKAADDIKSQVTKREGAQTG